MREQAGLGRSVCPRTPRVMTLPPLPTPSTITGQFWCGTMFNVQIVGTANAIAGGWGNMGGGACHFIMPLIYQGIKDGGVPGYQVRAWWVSGCERACACTCTCTCLCGWLRARVSSVSWSPDTTR